ncbi:MAG: helix-turn-helix domain-containing protein [Oscillospiraceae bacterium]|nr:helix-turn-helix domain-containing protein [Oscillospiraceae bacterium]
MDEEYVMFKEFCDICGICPATGRKAVENKKVSFKRCQDGKLHYYQIPLCEVLKYKEERENQGKFSKEEIEKMRKYYSNKLRKYPELLFSEDVQEITGYSKEAIRKWIKSGKLEALLVKRRFCVAKTDLIEFLLSASYENIIQKTTLHMSARYALGIRVSKTHKTIRK